MSEKKLEECSLEEATHVAMAGKVYKLGPNDGHESRYQVLKYNRYYIEVYMESAGWQLLQAYAFPILGIKPMREAKPKPIEFEHIFTFEETSLGIIPCEAEGKRFRCVEILEEKK